MKRNFLLKVLAMSVLLLSANVMMAALTFERNGITYEVISQEKNEVAVVSIEYQSGAVTYDIPSILEYEGVKYTPVELRRSVDKYTELPWVADLCPGILSISKTIRKITPEFFKRFRPQVTIEAENPYFTVEEGMVMSKNKEVLISFVGNYLHEYHSDPEYPRFIICTKRPPIIIPKEVKEIAPYAFYYNDSRYSESMYTNTRFEGRDISFPANLEKIGKSAFFNVPFESSIDLPSTLVELGDSAFYGAMIEKINISPSAQLKEIPYCAFKEASIEIFNIPKSVEKIGDKAFLNTRLKYVIIPDNVKEIGRRAFGGEFCLVNYNNAEMSSFWFIEYPTELEYFYCSSQNPNYESRDDMLLTKDGRLLYCPKDHKFEYNTLPSYITSIEEGALSCRYKYPILNLGNTIEEVDFSSFSKGQTLILGENVKRITFNDRQYQEDLANKSTSIVGEYYNNLNDLSGYKAIYITNEEQVPEISKNAFSQFSPKVELYVPCDLYQDFVALREDFIKEGYSFPENIKACVYPTVVITPSKESRFSLDVGERKKLNFEYTPIGNVKVERLEWESSNPECASVDADGVVMCLSAGLNIKIKCTMHLEIGEPQSIEWTMNAYGGSGIENISCEDCEITPETEIYNLEGVRLNIPIEELPSGMYVVRTNGVAHKILKK